LSSLFVWYVGSSNDVKYSNSTIKTQIYSFISYYYFLFQYHGAFLTLEAFWIGRFSTLFTFFFFLKFLLINYLPRIVFINWIYLMPDLCSVVTIKVYFVYLMPFLIALKIPELVYFIKTSLFYVSLCYLIHLFYSTIPFWIKFISIFMFILKDIFMFILTIHITLVLKLYYLYSFTAFFHFYINLFYDIYNDLCYFYYPNFMIPNFYYTSDIVERQFYDFEKCQFNHILIYFFRILVYYILI
jgi:hypothetical protein